MKEYPELPESLLIVFQLNGMNYGIQGEKIQEVLDFITITSVPLSPDFIAGIINVRGRIVTILDINNLLDLPPFSFDRDSNILFLEHDSIDIGLMVKSLKEIKKLSSGFLETHFQPHVDINRQHQLIKGTITLDSTSINLLDVDALFKFVDGYSFNESKL